MYGSLGGRSVRDRHCRAGCSSACPGLAAEHTAAGRAARHQITEVCASCGRGRMHDVILRRGSGKERRWVVKFSAPVEY